MSGELDREARKGRLMRAGEIAHHEALRLEVAIGHAAQDLGVEVAGKYALGHGENVSGEG